MPRRNGRTEEQKLNAARARGVFTTGQVARLLGTCARTVSKWLDAGKLEGYRLPGSQDRRITAAALGRFASKAGIPLAHGALSGTSVLALSPDDGRRRQLVDALKLFGLRAEGTGSLFLAGLAFRDTVWGAVVIDLEDRQEAATVASAALAEAARHWPSGKRSRVLVLTAEDGSWAGLPPGGVTEFQRPADPYAVAEAAAKACHAGAASVG